MDRGEFTSQVLACERKMYRTAYCMLRNEADCQDAVQETIFSAWRNLLRLRDGDAFDAWIMQILVNTCRTLLRKRKRRGEVALTEACPLPQSPDIRLYDAVRSLDERLRWPVVLRYVNGYSSQEVGIALKGVDVDNLPLEEIIRQSRKKMVK